MIFLYFAEIRYRFGYYIFSFFISFFLCYFYSLELFYLFARPFLHLKGHLFLYEKGFIFTNLTEAFQTTLKMCFFYSFLFVIPVLFYQLWCFFSPSWYLFERRRAKRYIFYATLFIFLGGFSFYFLILPQFLDFLLHFKIESPLLTIQLEARIDSYVRISSGVFLIVQFIFQTPLFFYFMYNSGYINSTFLSENRKIFVLLLLLVSALLTPPDPLTECLVFSFFWFFFEFMVWIGFLEWKTEKEKKANKKYDQ